VVGNVDSTVMMHNLPTAAEIWKSLFNESKLRTEFIKRYSSENVYKIELLSNLYLILK